MYTSLQISPSKRLFRPSRLFPLAWMLVVALTVSTLQPVFGIGSQSAAALAGDPGSIEFDGASSLSYPSSDNFSLSGDYTVELWTKFAKNPRSGNQIISRWKSGSQEYSLSATGGNPYQNAGGGTDWKWIQKTTTGEVSVTFTKPSVNVWHHVAIVRSSNNITAYLDGVSVGTGTFTGTVKTGITSPLEIGGLSNATGGYFDTNNFTGRISNVRISKTAIYTTGFTPSTAPLASVAETSFLLNMAQGAAYSDSQNGSVATETGTPLSNSDVPFALSVPAPPSQVRGTSNVGTTSTISWIASPEISGQGANTYTVVGSNDGINFSEVTGCVLVSGTSCTATGLVLARGYVFKARAKNVAGYSEYSLLEASSSGHFRPLSFTACAEINVLGTSACGLFSNIQPLTTAVMPAATFCTKIDGVLMNQGGIQPDIGVFDADGNMYFVLGNSVRKMTQAGFGASSNCTTSTFSASGLLKSPNGASIGMDAAGNIYVSNNDASDKSVVKISADGTTAETYLTTQQTGGTINGIIFDSDQNLIGYQNIAVAFDVYLVKFANITKAKTKIVSFNSNAILPTLGGNKSITGVSLNAFDDIFLSFIGGGQDYLVRFDSTFVQPVPAICVNTCTQDQINQNKANLIYDSTGTLWPGNYPPTVKILSKFESYTWTRASVVDSEGNTWVPQAADRRLLKLNADGKPVLSTRTGTSLDGDPFEFTRMKIDPSGNVWVQVTNGTWGWVIIPGATKPFLRQLTYKGIGSTPYRAGKTAQIQLDGSTGAVAFKTTNAGDISVSSTGVVTASSALEPGKYSVSGTALDSANTAGTWTYTLNVLKALPTVEISSAPTSSVHQETVTFTATASEFDSGTVITFKNGPSSVGTCTLAIATPCTLEISTLAVGNNSITAVVAESAHYLTATSAALTHTVGLQPTSTTFSVSSLPTVGQAITLSAQVTSNSATGTVSFKKPDGTVLCTTSALVSGAGSCVWSGNPGVGTYSVTAVYSGDAAYRTSTSAAASVDVTALYTVTFSTGAPSAVYRTGTTAVPLPLPTRSGFVFDGWFDAAQGGNFIGMAATGYSPTASISLYPHWTQLSLSGIAPADLNLLGTINASNFVDATYSATTNGSSVSISIPQGSLPNQTQVSVHLVGNFDRARALISQTNTYVMTMVISWIAPDGTVPPTDPNKPITMVISNNTIKTGTAVYGLLGGQVTLLGRAVVDGTVTVHITEDPQVVVANTPPTSPVTVAATSGLDSRTVISWSEPTNDGGSPVTSYTVTANNGLSCTTTALSCQITGLTNGQSYTFGVVATNVNGESSPSVRTSATPISPISAAGLAQTGQDSNSILLFGFLAVLLGFGFVLIRSRIKK